MPEERDQTCPIKALVLTYSIQTKKILINLTRLWIWIFVIIINNVTFIKESILINLMSKPLVFINLRDDAFVNYPNEKNSEQFHEIVE